MAASVPVPTTLSQKARPEGATVSSHAAASAALLASGCKRIFRKPKQKLKPSASLLLRVGFTFVCKGGKGLFWGWLENLIFDVSVELEFFMSSTLALGTLNFLGFTVPIENANELISSPPPPPSILKEIKQDRLLQE